METKTRGALLFGICLVYSVFLYFLGGRVSLAARVIFQVIFVIIIWTLIYWAFRNLPFFTNLSQKFTGFGSFFKYGGYFMFFISGMNAIAASFRFEGSKALVAFWGYIILGLIFIPVFYLLGMTFTKIEKGEWFEKRAIEIKAGLILAISLTFIFLVLSILAISVGPLISPESFSKTFESYLVQMILIAIPAFIIFFIMGAIIGFIGRIYEKFFAGTSRLFEKNEH